MVLEWDSREAHTWHIYKVIKWLICLCVCNCTYTYIHVYKVGLYNLPIFTVEIAWMILKRP